MAFQNVQGLVETDGVPVRQIRYANFTQPNNKVSCPCASIVMYQPDETFEECDITHAGGFKYQINYTITYPTP
jgi:hypothetical protein